MYPEVSDDPARRLYNREVKSGQKTFIFWGPRRDTTAFEGTGEDKREGAGVTINEGENKNLALAIVEEPKTSIFVLCAFADGTRMNIEITGAGNFQEDNGVPTALSRRPRSKYLGGETGIKSTTSRKEDNVGSGGRRAREGPRGYGRDTNTGSTVDGIMVAFSILKKGTGSETTSADGNGD